LGSPSNRRGKQPVSPLKSNERRRKNKGARVIIGEKIRAPYSKLQTIIHAKIGLGNKNLVHNGQELSTQGGRIRSERTRRV